MRLVIASRKSDLARLQALQVAAALKEKHPELEIVHHFRESLGDREQANPLWQMPEKGVFTEDFAQGLRDGEFDLIVHSWKDLPTEPRPDSEVAATLPRADARDVLLVRRSVLQESKSSWKILSSSPRRVHFLNDIRPRLLPKGTPVFDFQSVRGNIPTRLSKLDQGEGDALLVAKAALDRLLATTENEFSEARRVIRKTLQNCQWMVLPLTLEPPAPAQGALAIEIKKNRDDLKKLLAAVHCTDTFDNVRWEREQLRAFGGGCHLKLGALAKTVSGAPVRLVRGLPTPERPVSRFWIERPSKKSANGPLCALRSADLFTTESLTPALQGRAFWIAHQKAIPASLPKDAYLWTSGLKTWEALAALGHWVHGSDESFGESVPDVELLADENLSWQKLTHAGSTEGVLPAVPVYRLSKKSPSPETVDRVLSSDHFYWHSGSLLEQALVLWPQIRSAHHACGLGLTRQTLERTLGPLGKDQVFLDEAEWRMFYGAADAGFKKSF